MSVKGWMVEADNESVNSGKYAKIQHCKNHAPHSDNGKALCWHFFSSLNIDSLEGYLSKLDILHVLVP